MPFALKLVFANLIIVSCVLLGKRFPSLAGLIATMPITTLIVLVWLQEDNPGDSQLITTFVGGVFWGVIPSLFFFATAWLCLRRGTPVFPTLTISFAVWLPGAIVHQALLK
jgi:F0F1-type ATP synthase assembly protein I